MAKPLTEIVCDYKGNFLISGTRTKVLVMPIGNTESMRSDKKTHFEARRELEQRIARGHTNKNVNAYNLTMQGWPEGFWIGAIQYYRAAKSL